MELSERIQENIAGSLDACLEKDRENVHYGVRNEDVLRRVDSS